MCKQIDQIFQSLTLCKMVYGYSLVQWNVFKPQKNKITYFINKIN